MTGDVVALAQFRSHIDAALSYAGESHRYEDVAEMIAAGTAQVFPGPASVLITELIDDPRRRRLHIFLAAGNLHELNAMLPIALEWGKSKGCTQATFTGRQGWTRASLREAATASTLATQGWTLSHVTFTKPL